MTIRNACYLKRWGFWHPSLYNKHQLSSSIEVASVSIVVNHYICGTICNLFLQLPFGFFICFLSKDLNLLPLILLLGIYFVNCCTLSVATYWVNLFYVLVMFKDKSLNFVVSCIIVLTPCNIGDGSFVL